MAKSARRLVTLPAETDERAMKFCSGVGLNISNGLAMLIAAALDTIDGVAPAQLCNCDYAKTCAAMLKKQHIGLCRRQRDRKEA